MTSWVVAETLLAAMWRMDRDARRRGARIRSSDDMRRTSGSRARRAPTRRGRSTTTAAAWA